jgi:hypothetical protein
MQYVSGILIEVAHSIIRYVGKYWDNVTKYSSELCRCIHLRCTR